MSRLINRGLKAVAFASAVVALALPSWVAVTTFAATSNSQFGNGAPPAPGQRRIHRRL